jgi:hypothetical protein
MSGARYRLQRREQAVMPNVLGNHSFPVYTYRWRDIAASDDKAELANLMPAGNGYRIEDTRPQEAGKGE